MRIWRLSVWSNRDFVRLWSAAIGSAYGSNITSLAIPFVAILTLDATPWQIGLLSIAQLLPAFLIGLIAGAWVDRLPRRPIMIGCDLFRAGVLITVPLAAWWDLLTFAHLLIVAALGSLATTAFEIADRSMLPTVVRSDELLDANRMLTAGQMTAETTGFASAGWLVQLASGPGALAIDAVTFLWSALFLRHLEANEPVAAAPDDDATIRGEIIDGLRVVMHDRVLRPLVLSRSLLYLGVGIVGTVYMLYVTKTLGFSPGMLGVLFATGGLFSLLGSLIADRTTGWFGIGPTLAITAVLTGCGSSLIALPTAATLIAALCIVVQQASDICWTTYEIAEITLRQSTAPEAMQGRVNGTFRVMEVGASMIGALLGGWLGSVSGERTTLVFGASIVATAALPVLLSPLRRVMHHELQAET